MTLLAHPVNDSGKVEVLDTTEHLVEKVGHPLVVQVQIDDLEDQFIRDPLGVRGRDIDIKTVI